MLKFRVNCDLIFEAETIFKAREKLNELNFFLKQLHQTDLSVSEKERLFEEDDLVKIG